MKDTDFCSSAGKEEQNASKLAMMRSAVLSDVATSAKDSEEFINRKRRNEDARECACGHRCNAEVLARTNRRLDELEIIDDKEIAHCRDALNSQNHCEKQRHSNAVEKHVTANKTKQPNASVRIAGANFTPLLVGKVQIGTITNIQRELIIEELFLRGMVVERKELIAKMKQLLVEHEHPNAKCEMTKKCFFPKLLAASD